MSNPVLKSLSGKTVLVTGADGFIGSHLVERLAEEGANVRAMCLYNSNGSAGWLDDSPVLRDGSLDVVLGDVRDPEFVRRVVSGADVVLHLAALIAIPYSYEAPRSFVDTNVMGTLNVLEAVRAEGTPQLVNTSTSEVYGTPETVPIDESHHLRAQSPYSATKIAADKLCESYALSFETPVTILRPFNTFGPRQSMRAVIPTILAQLIAGVREVSLGAVDPRRDFTFVSDTCDGFVRAATAGLEPGSVVQLGTGRTVSVREVFDICAKVVGVEARIITDDRRIRPAGSEVEILQSDPKRALETLGWRPSVSLEEGLAATAEWLRTRVDKHSAQEYHR